MKILFLALILFISNLNAKSKNEIVVAADGSGDVKTITEAVKLLPMFNYGRIIIFIKNGLYNEKVRIERDNVTFRGESRENTIWQYSQLRSDWDINKDNIGPGVLNIYADDIIVENITIENTQPEIGPHAFVIYGFGTRTILQNSNFKSKGADTVSLWDYKTGMYYHSNCYFEGAVDFVCPRGWCYIKDSKFFEHKKTASVWHAGSFDINQKFVIVNSYFDGVEGFELGRHHYESQFFFIECKFSENMSDREIYRVTYPDEPERDRSFNWGKRIYFYNSQKQGSELSWLKSNLVLARDSINANWAFDGKWDPENPDDVFALGFKIHDNELYIYMSERVAVIGSPILKSTNGTIFRFHSGGENNTLRFIAERKIEQGDIHDLEIVNEDKIIATIASIKERNANLKINFQ